MFQEIFSHEREVCSKVSATVRPYQATIPSTSNLKTSPVEAATWETEELKEERLGLEDRVNPNPNSGQGKGRRAETTRGGRYSGRKEDMGKEPPIVEGCLMKWRRK